MPRGEFEAMLNDAFGEGKYRITSGWRSQRHENNLRAQGADTVRPGRISAHSRGTAEAPGGWDLVVDGMKPSQAAARLRERHPQLFRQLYPHDTRSGSQGPHLHLGMNEGARYAGSPGAYRADTVQRSWREDAVQNPPKRNTPGRLGAFGLGKLIEGSGDALQGLGRLGDFVSQAIANQAAGGAIINPVTGQSMAVPERERAGFDRIVKENQRLISPTTSPLAQQLTARGEAITPANPSTAESIVGGSG